MPRPNFSIATWNINSVRLRIDGVLAFLEAEKPDVLCLQEIKCADDQFPAKALKQQGYIHQAVRGQKGYHGVAIVARAPLEQIDFHDFCGKGDARHIEATLAAGPGKGLRLHNFYVPAGGDEPDPAINDKFAHKLAFLDEMQSWDGLRAAGERPSILVGDLNIAPLEHDVWSTKQLANVVSHTPLERRRLTEVREHGGWADAMRHKIPDDQKLYTWWSYRSPDWNAADKGRRLDHVWVAPNLLAGLESIEVHRTCRGWERPSDHAPVVARFTL